MAYELENLIKYFYIQKKKDSDFAESFILVVSCESNTAPTDYEPKPSQ
jgi:hypothetical protein